MGWPAVVWYHCRGPSGYLFIVVAPSFAGFDSSSCMAVYGSRFWFGLRFGSCDASCLDVCLLLDGPCHWSGCCFYLGWYVLYVRYSLSLMVRASFRLAWCLLLGNFVLDPSFCASHPPSMLEVVSVVLLADGLLADLPWWWRRDFRDVLYWGCPPCSYLGVATLLLPVHLLEPSPCSSSGSSAVWWYSCSRNLALALNWNLTLCSVG